MHHWKIGLRRDRERACHHDVLKCFLGTMGRRGTTGSLSLIRQRFDARSCSYSNSNTPRMAQWLTCAITVRTQCDLTVRARTRTLRSFCVLPAPENPSRSAWTVGRQAGFDVAQALAPRQLREGASRETARHKTMCAHVAVVARHDARHALSKVRTP